MTHNAVPAPIPANLETTLITVAGWISPTSFLAAVEAAERDDEDGIRSALARREEVA